MRESIQIISVNVGRSQTILHGGETHRTGIRKKPASGSVQVTEQGLAGDSVVDTRAHGGVDQAVYVYRDEDYRWWAGETGRDFPAGTFGENLTIRGLPDNLYIGDRLLIGDVILEATAARIPCSTLSAVMADSGFGMAFRKAERPGTYFRVLNPGPIGVGDTITLIESEGGDVTVLDLFRFAYRNSHEPSELRRFLAAPIAERVRAQVEQALAKVEAQ